MDFLTGLEDVPIEILYKFLLPLSYVQIINFCLTNRQYQELICQNWHFWATKANKDFGITSNQFYNMIYRNPQLNYLALITTKNRKCIRGSEKVIDINTCLMLATDEGNLDLTKYFLNKGISFLNVDILEDLLYNAAKSGNFDLVLYLIPYLKRYSLLEKYLLDNALMYAGEGGNPIIIDYLLSIGANNIDQLIDGAIKNGNLDLIKDLFTRFPIVDNNKYSRFLLSAINTQNQQLVSYLLTKIKDININLILPVRSAALIGDKSLVDDLLSRQFNIINL